MSRVVSFRLDEDIVEEGQALEILEAWQAKGYSIRQIMTWALMALEGAEPQNNSAPDGETGATIAELKSVLGQAQEFLEVLRDMKAMPDEVKLPSQQKPILSDTFMASVKKAVRPGLKLDE
ncbi:MAG: hypothetical protein K8L91_00525 [Anaerolineae bacterium]|nr:hypothetical protein [Anaerolineae bacterium]